MNIVEFLEARIAEDEADNATQAQLDDDDRGGWAIAYSQRVLAECAAKRVIVEQAVEASNDRSTLVEDGCLGEPARSEAYASDPGLLIMCALAAVYRDHSDYQPEWSL